MCSKRWQFPQALVTSCTPPHPLRYGHRNNQSGPEPGSEEVTHNIARLTVRLLLHGEERLATQLGAAGHADEAVDVEDLVHGSAASTFTHYVLSTAGAAPWGEESEEEDI